MVLNSIEKSQEQEEGVKDKLCKEGLTEKLDMSKDREYVKDLLYI